MITKKIIFNIVDIICGIAILISFFALPFIDVKYFFSALGAKSSAYQFITYLTAQGNNNGAFQFIASVYILYFFVGIALLLIIRGLLGFFIKKDRIHLVSIIRKILISLILYGVIPLLVIFNFYAVVLNYTGQHTLAGIPYSFSNILEIAQPLLGVYLILGGSIVSSIIGIVKAIGRLFKKPHPQG